MEMLWRGKFEFLVTEKSEKNLRRIKSGIMSLFIATLLDESKKKNYIYTLNTVKITKIKMYPRLHTTQTT